VVVFMTGASGAAGRAILDRLCDEPLVERVYALVHRSGLPSAGAKVRAVRGTISAGATLGLDPQTARLVTAEATAVLHAAADTRFDAPIEILRAVNVEGTLRVLDWARQAAGLDRVLVLSTVYVAGRRTGRITEDDLIHDAGFVNHYERSKYEMEEALADCRDVPVAVARLSTIVGDSRDGRVARSAAFHHALRLYYQSLAPMLPGTPDSPVDLIPLDYAADAVVTLLCREYRAGARWHVCAGDDAPCLDELLDLAIEAFLASRPAWRRRAIARPAIVPLSAFDRFADSVEELRDTALSAATRSVRPFAPQLAYPKWFDETAARGCLAAHGIVPAPFREYFPRVVDHLIRTHWSGAQVPA
jgi:nucleoside-diphosphate-sugar epimerase